MACVLAGDIELAAGVFRNALLAGSAAEAQHAVCYSTARKATIDIVSSSKYRMETKAHTLSQCSVYCTRANILNKHSAIYIGWMYTSI